MYLRYIITFDLYNSNIHNMNIQINELILYLSKNPTDVNLVDLNGKSLLYNAIYNKNYELIPILLQYKHTDDQESVILSIKYELFNITKLLLDNNFSLIYYDFRKNNLYNISSNDLKNRKLTNLLFKYYQKQNVLNDLIYHLNCYGYNSIYYMILFKYNDHFEILINNIDFIDRFNIDQYLHNSLYSHNYYIYTLLIKYYINHYKINKNDQLLVSKFNKIFNHRLNNQFLKILLSVTDLPNLYIEKCIKHNNRAIFYKKYHVILYKYFIQKLRNIIYTELLNQFILQKVIYNPKFKFIKNISFQFSQ